MSFFDFNNDGIVDLGEEFLAYQIFEDTMRDYKRKTDADYDLDSDDYDEDDYLDCDEFEDDDY